MHSAVPLRSRLTVNYSVIKFLKDVVSVPGCPLIAQATEIN